jgi:hypothetical protein
MIANPDFDVWITGHSLGGAMASVSAFDLVWNTTLFSHKSPLVYTFGQPRTGDTAYARIYDKFVPNTFRVVNDDDPVPHLPPCSSSVGLTACDASVAASPYHHGTEIWYPEVQYQNDVMCDYRECTHDPSGMGDDYSCSDHVSTFAFGDHSGYWNVVPPLAPAGRSFCGLAEASHGHPKQPELSPGCNGTVKVKVKGER